MNVDSVALLQTGLVSPVGLDAPNTCAALRAKLSNPVQTRFIDADGEWIMGHGVPLEAGWHGLPRLARMAALAIEEAMHGIPGSDWAAVPLLLCVAEKDRPGRPEGLDERLLDLLQAELDRGFDARSAIVAQGRVGVAVALARARSLIHQHRVPRVLIAATDSLLSWPTLRHYEGQRRVLTPSNSNGFMPGEGAGALLVGPAGAAPQLLCTGIGFGLEPAPLDAEAPLRADGLVRALQAALAEAGCDMHDMDFRIADLSGEHYYFKEAALALARTLRRPKPEFDLWHPAECIGEAGALAGAAVLALADAACRKRFAKGNAIVAHLANDDGRRAALTLHFRST